MCMNRRRSFFVRELQTSTSLITDIIKLQKRREDFTYGRAEERYLSLDKGA